MARRKGTGGSGPTSSAKPSPRKRLWARERNTAAARRVPDLPYPVVVVLDYRTFDAFTTAAFRTPYGDVNVVLRPDARGPRRHFTYDELNTRAQTRRALGVTIRVADLDDIVESKAAAGRPQDLAALPHLAALRATLAQQALSQNPTTDVELSGPEEHDGHGLDS